jgi:two-component system KDP operon response regulator KdpE
MARILIVDDDPQFRRTLRLALDSSGYEVGDVAGGKEALDRVAGLEPDLIVLDWQLPDMDGIQTCKALRAHSDVPVIIVTGNRANPEAVALNAGANDYLTKPFSVNELLMRIESALKH